MPQILMGLDQMFGPLGDRGLQGLVGGFGCGQRILQFAAGPAGRARQHGGQQQDQRHAGQIDRQQEAPAGVGRRAALRQQPAFLRRDLLQIGGDLVRHGAAFGPCHQCRYPGLIAGGMKPDQLGADGDLTGHQRARLVEQLGFDGGRDGSDQVIEGGHERRAGLAVFPDEIRIAADRKAARGTFGAAQQRPHVRDLLQHLERVVDGGRIRPRLEIQTDRGSANEKQDREAGSKDGTLRRHSRFLVQFFEMRSDFVVLVRHSFTVVNSAFGVNGLRRQHVAPSSMVMRRKSGARSVLAKA